MARKTPKLDLTPELPEVVSRDFNLFYRPEAEPEIAGMKEFTASLDNFVNGGKTSTMKDRITAYKVLLNRAIETAQQTAEDTTFTGYPPQYVASLNPGEEVFHILQIPN